MSLSPGLSLWRRWWRRRRKRRRRGSPVCLPAVCGGGGGGSHLPVSPRSSLSLALTTFNQSVPQQFVERRRWGSPVCLQAVCGGGGGGGSHSPVSPNISTHHSPPVCLPAVGGEEGVTSLSPSSLWRRRSVTLSTHHGPQVCLPESLQFVERRGSTVYLHAVCGGGGGGSHSPVSPSSNPSNLTV